MIMVRRRTSFVVVLMFKNNTLDPPDTDAGHSGPDLRHFLEMQLQPST